MRERRTRGFAGYVGSSTLIALNRNGVALKISQIIIFAVSCLLLIFTLSLLDYKDLPIQVLEVSGSHLEGRIGEEFLQNIEMENREIWLFVKTGFGYFAKSQLLINEDFTWICSTTGGKDDNAQKFLFVVIPVSQNRTVDQWRENAEQLQVRDIRNIGGKTIVATPPRKKNVFENIYIVLKPLDSILAIISLFEMIYITRRLKLGKVLRDCNRILKLLKKGKIKCSKLKK